MMRALMLSGLVLMGCASAPSAPKPTPADVATVKDEVRILGDKAKLNAPWSGAQVATIAAEVSDVQHRIDQLATAAGIAPTKTATTAASK